MSFGIQIFKANGQVTYDSSMVTWNQVATVSIPANSSHVQYLSHAIKDKPLEDTLVLQFFVNAPAIDRESHMPVLQLVTSPLPVLSTLTTGEASVAVVLMR
jgi:hypothetical protein